MKGLMSFAAAICTFKSVLRAGVQPHEAKKSCWR